MREIGHRIAARMDALGWGQDALAGKAGVSQTTVSNLVNGAIGDMKVTTLMKIARALDIPVAQLIPASDDETDAELEATLEGTEPELRQSRRNLILGERAAEERRDREAAMRREGGGGTGSRSTAARLANLYEAVATALEVIAPHIEGLTLRESEQLRDAMQRLAS